MDQPVYDTPIGEIIAQTDILAVYERATGMSANGRAYPDYRLVRCFDTKAHSRGDRKPSLILNTTKKHFTCLVGHCAQKGKLLDLIRNAVPEVTSKFAAVNWLREQNLIGYKLDVTRSPRVELFSDDDFISKELVASFLYKNEANENHARVLRYRVRLKDGTIDKDIRSYHWNAEKNLWVPGTEGIEKIPYNLPALLEGGRRGEVLFWPEGEPKVDGITSDLGLLASTNMNGSKVSYPLSWARYFKGIRGVIVMPDCDEAGRKAAAVRRDFFRSIGLPVTTLDIDRTRNDGYDIKDWLVERKNRSLDAKLQEFRTLYRRTRSLQIAS
jgi:hypothetical protein